MATGNYKNRSLFISFRYIHFISNLTVEKFLIHQVESKVKMLLMNLLLSLTFIVLSIHFYLFLQMRHQVLEVHN